MSVESCGTVSHHHSGAVRRVTLVGMYVMKIKRGMNQKDLILHGENLKTGIPPMTSHLIQTSCTQQLTQRSVGILPMIVIIINFGTVRIGVNLKTMERMMSLRKKTA